MAGYLGTKAVLLSTTAADVVGNAEIGGDLTVGGAFTSQGIDDNASATAMTLDASGNVGIGTSSPSAPLDIGTASPEIRLTDATDDGYTRIRYDGGAFFIEVDDDNSVSDSNFRVQVDGSEAMRIDSSGNLLVGTVSDVFPGLNDTNTGFSVLSDGRVGASTDDDFVLNLNRNNSDGNIATFRKDGSTVGSIGSAGSGLVYYFTGPQNGVKIVGPAAGVDSFGPSSTTGANRDNQMDLGWSSNRWDDIYATNGTIQTSDRNEKQDIEALSDAEQRVAVACKGLLRKFRWKDAVAEKGDDARIHFGIIAQDLQAAFEAEGLDAGRYAMFISSTWWETQTDVPAVEAVAEVQDEEGNVVTEAVEAKEAYTRTDTYKTLEEAPEGATERTRLGVRYPELLAFIIGAM